MTRRLEPEEQTASASQRPIRSASSGRPAKTAVSGSSLPSAVLALQRAIGNRAVDRVLSGARMHEVAAAGVRGPGQPLPHLDRIQAAFGPGYDLSRVRAHTGAAAAAASRAIGAEAYATGDRIAFAAAHPDLRSVAHEAAHVVQQWAGVQLKGGIGAAGDAYERQADAVADRVARGAPAGAFIADGPGAGHATGQALQRKISVGEATLSNGSQLDDDDAYSSALDEFVSGLNVEQENTTTQYIKDAVTGKIRSWIESDTDVVNWLGASFRDWKQAMEQAYVDVRVEAEFTGERHKNLEQQREYSTGEFRERVNKLVTGIAHELGVSDTSMKHERDENNNNSSEKNDNYSMTTGRSTLLNRSLNVPYQEGGSRFGTDDAYAGMFSFDPASVKGQTVLDLACGLSIFGSEAEAAFGAERVDRVDLNADSFTPEAKEKVVTRYVVGMQALRYVGNYDARALQQLTEGVYVGKNDPSALPGSTVAYQPTLARLDALRTLDTLEHRRTEILKNYMAATVKKDNATKLSCPNDSYHTVLCGWLLMYLPKGERKKVLKEMVRVTKPGGVIRIVPGNTVSQVQISQSDVKSASEGSGKEVTVEALRGGRLFVLRVEKGRSTCSIQ